MSRKRGQVCAATEKALKQWRPGADYNAVALRCGINPSTMYRALIRAGLMRKKR